jgi:hypothetical protein
MSTTFFSGFHPEGIGAKGSAAFPSSLQIVLTSDAVVVPSNSDGTSTDFTGASTTVTVLESGQDVTALWTITPVASSGLTFSSVGNTYSVTALTGNSGSITFNATRMGYTSLSAVFTISKALAGLSGLNGVSAISGFLTNESVTLFAFANGIISSYSGATGQFKVFSGSTDISSSFVLSTVSNPQALSVTYVGQTYTVTGGFDANEETATLTIRATGTGDWAGIFIDKVFSLSKARGGYEILSSLPEIGDPRRFEGSIVFLTTDDKLYRFDGTNWTTAVPAVDITGQLISSQLSDASVEAAKIADGAVVSDKIAANSITATKLVLANRDDVFPDTGFRDLSWHNLLGLGTGNDASGAGSPPRFFQTAALGEWDRFSSKVTVERGATYRVTLRIFVSSSASGWFGSSVHFPGITWAIPGFNDFVDGGSYPIIQLASIPRDQWLTYTIQESTTSVFDSILELRHRWSLSSGFVRYAYEVVRASDSSLIVDGAVVANKIAANAITADKIEANAVTAVKLAANSVTADKIQAGSVTAAKIGVTELSAITANVGDLTAGTIRNSADTFRIELNNGRTIARTGSVMKVTGAPFGSSNQFIEWYGPFFSNLASCTESNATYYLKTDGSAYFGGTLSAGVLKNSATSTLIAADAGLILGPFGSVPGARNVVASYSFNWSGPHFDTSAGIGSSSSTVNLWIDRRITGGSFERISEWDATINASWSEAFSPSEPGSVTMVGGGSVTLTDSVSTTQNVEYWLRIASRPLPAGAPPPSTPMSQFLSLTSTQG